MPEYYCNEGVLLTADRYMRQFRTYVHEGQTYLCEDRSSDWPNNPAIGPKYDVLLT